MRRRTFSIFAVIIMILSLAACAGNNVSSSGISNQISAVETVNPESEIEISDEEKLSNVSQITSEADVPMVVLNNGVEMPQLGLGTQIQRLESDSSERGRELLNETSREAVISTLQAEYRHLDTGYGYYNEYGVGQGIIDSGVPEKKFG